MLIDGDVRIFPDEVKELLQGLAAEIFLLTVFYAVHGLCSFIDFIINSLMPYVPRTLISLSKHLGIARQMYRTF